MTNPLNDPRLDTLMEELVTKHRCHTVILYGSRARGDATANSDYDILGVRKSGKRYRIAEKRAGYYLDAFVYPEADLEKVGEDLLYMQDAKLLFQKTDFGTRFIKKLRAAAKRRYKPLSENDIEVRRVWLHKMYARATQDDIEGLYRRRWLQQALIEEYFNIRKARYTGPKHSLIWLKAHDPETYTAYTKSLKNPDNLRILRKLVERTSQRAL